MNGGEIILRSYKIRLIPDHDQIDKLKQMSGIQRFIYNNLLYYCMDCYNQSSYYIDKKDIKTCFCQFVKLITSSKKLDCYKWLNDISRHTINIIQRDLLRAYNKFFEYQNTDKFKKEYGKDKYKYRYHPKFKKKKDNKISIPFDANDVYYDGNGYIQFVKLGRIKIKTNLNIPKGSCFNSKNHKNYILNPRIKFINNKWILCFAMEIDSQEIQLNKDLVIGIDIGIKDLCAVTNINGNDKIYPNINKKLKRIYRLEKRIIHLNNMIIQKYQTFKKFNNNQKFIRSKSFDKICAKIQKVYYKLSNIRNNYLHHVSREIINQKPQIIVIENFDLKFLINNRSLSKAALNQKLGLFRWMLEYKSEEYGIKLILVDDNYPSTQLCCRCGSKQKMNLKTRIYKCPCCGLELDRDINAAKNLELYGREFLDY